MRLLNRIVDVAASLVRDAADSSRRRGPGASRRSGRSTTAERDGGLESARTTVPYEGQLPALQYVPQDDDAADPGEVVWAWVPYDENDGRGKDRPVLVIARYRGGYLGLQTTSKDHDRDAADEARWGRYWFDIGHGTWDSQGRESEVRLDRVLYLPAGAVRRIGAVLERRRYDAVAQALQTHRAEHGG
jgi:hypothetical protein